MFTLDPSTGAALTVRTRKGGAAAKAGHDLVIAVTDWSATVDLDAPAITLTADSGSLEVLEGTGGIQSLSDEDKAGIKQTIDDEILKRTPIAFRSTSAAATDGGWRVEGDLELNGTAKPVAFEMHMADGRLTGSTVVTQTDFGIEPFSALFGTLKVKDDVEVHIDAPLPA